LNPAARSRTLRRVIKPLRLQDAGRSPSERARSVMGVHKKAMDANKPIQFALSEKCAELFES
jgi:hypothetical protein